MSAARTKAQPALCCVSIGLTQMLMPSDVGLKVVALLREAVLCDKDYSCSAHAYQYTIQDAPEVEYSAVKPSQVVAPRVTDTPIGPLRIGREPLKLTRG